MVALYLDPVVNLWLGSGLLTGIVLQIADAAFPGLLVLGRHFASQTQAVKIFLSRAGGRLAECSEQPWHDGPGRGVTINSLLLIELSI